jgi:hypothetical protein
MKEGIMMMIVDIFFLLCIILNRTCLYVYKRKGLMMMMRMRNKHVEKEEKKRQAKQDE